MVDVDRVVDRGQEHRVEGFVGRAEDVQSDQARSGSDAENPNVARLGQAGVEVLEVVDLPALRGDRTRVLECLAPIGRSRCPGSAEVLVVDEHRLTVGSNEVRIVDVETVSNEPDLYAGTRVAQCLGRWGAAGIRCRVDREHGLWVELDLTALGAGVPQGPCTTTGPQGRGNTRGAVGHRDRLVGNNAGHVGVLRKPLGLTGTHGGGKGIDQAVGGDVGRVGLLQFARGMVPARRTLHLSVLSNERGCRESR